jgi:S1-C subfamily serine protease
VFHKGSNVTHRLNAGTLARGLYHKTPYAVLTTASRTRKYTMATRPMNVNKLYRVVTAALTVLTLTAMAIPSYGQVTSNVLLRTLLIQASDKLGTAFTIDVDGRQYLITAKHVVGMFQDGAVSTIQVRKKNGWTPLKVTVFKCDGAVDIAVLVPPAQVTVNFPLEPSSVGMVAGQEAYFVGFPYGTFATYTSQPTVFPLIKRATVAQFVRPTPNT